MTQSTKRIAIILSPLLIIGIGHIAARIATSILDVWAWIPINLLLWAMFAGFVSWGDGWQSLSRWLKPREGGLLWVILSMLVALIPLQLFLGNLALFDAAWLIVAYILFALINAPLEEFYWRGLLLDQMDGWPSWSSVLYTSIFFAVNHPLTLGVFSIANRHPGTLITTFILGVVWAITYKRTKSLRWIIVSHLLIDLLNLSILAFLNIYVPPEIPGF